MLWASDSPCLPRLRVPRESDSRELGGKRLRGFRRPPLRCEDKGDGEVDGEDIGVDDIEEACEDRTDSIGVDEGACEDRTDNIGVCFPGAVLEVLDGGLAKELELALTGIDVLIWGRTGVDELAFTDLRCLLFSA